MPVVNNTDSDTLLADPAPLAQPGLRLPGQGDQPECGQVPACYHCGAACPANPPRLEEKAFCCQGCLTVYELLAENGLGHFYDLGPQAGVRVNRPNSREQFAFLDEPAVRDRLVDYADDAICRVTFRIPAIHCIACVWLLENLFRLRPGISRSVVNFPRRECVVTFDPRAVRLSEVVALLASLGYEPDFNLAHLDSRRTDPAARRLWLRAGVAGFAFGNIMLLSIPHYTGLNGAEQPGLRMLFGALALALAVPVLVFSASDYWRAARVAWRRRVLNIELPIAVGLAALFGQSVYEIVSGHGSGYLDSMTGLVFFLLCGRIFQHKTYDHLAFDRDYRSFFPLSVTRLRYPVSAQSSEPGYETPKAGSRGPGEERVALAQLAVGDRLLIRHGELIPADARLVAGRALVDYSFVTGESEPVARQAGDHLYAGGRQMGGAIEVETVKPVSQSYLASLWSQEAFKQNRRDTLDNLTNRFSRRFTPTVAVIAVAAAVFWFWAGDGARAVRAFTAVLIVACPCALALAAPFALGSAQRLLARRGVFLKDPHVTEALARVNTVVFDKTGTLTTAGVTSVTFEGEPLNDTERRLIAALARHSTHPYASALTASLGEAGGPGEVADYREEPGAGVAGRVAGHEIRLGSAAWLRDGGVAMAATTAGPGVCVAVDGRFRGWFRLASPLRPDTETLLAGLAAGYELALLSGDSERERERFRGLFPASARLHFHQSPLNKLGFIRELQAAGRIVMMVGDGLNDAGALKQSDVGVAVAEQVGAFSPASDVILDADQVCSLPAVLRFARQVVRIVRLSFMLSSAYNLVGISIAASGLLSPLVCAILMPLSSVTVVGFACGATRRAARRAGLPAGSAPVGETRVA